MSEAGDSGGVEEDESVQLGARRVATVLEMLLHKKDVRDEQKLIELVCVCIGVFVGSNGLCSCIRLE